MWPIDFSYHFTKKPQYFPETLYTRWEFEIFPLIYMEHAFSQKFKCETRSGYLLCHQHYLSLGSFNFSTKNFMYWILHYYTLATTLTNNGRSTVSNSLIKNVTRSSLTFSKFIIQATRGGTVNTAAKLQNTVSSTDSATAPPACAVCWWKNCISKT